MHRRCPICSAAPFWLSPLGRYSPADRSAGASAVAMCPTRAKAHAVPADETNLPPATATAHARGRDTVDATGADTTRAISVGPAGPEIAGACDGSGADDSAAASGASAVVMAADRSDSATPTTHSTSSRPRARPEVAPTSSACARQAAASADAGVLGGAGGETDREGGVTDGRGGVSDVGGGPEWREGVDDDATTI
eukprot:scaffold2822_cov100-Isochrysis_galbana.AAC.10